MDSVKIGIYLQQDNLNVCAVEFSVASNVSIILKE